MDIKTYRGTIDGYDTAVTVNGQPLPLRLDLRNLSPDGFNWGYNGPGPSQLALAILADHFGDDNQALEYFEPFRSAVISCLAGGDPWILTTIEIVQALDELELGR